MKDSRFYKQAYLLIRILPLVMHEEVFALKGGTAINFFWRNFPRLSVDIDLTYLPIQERALSISDISDHLARIEVRIQRIIPGVNIQQSLSKEYGTITRLTVKTNDAIVKIEPNTVIRGTVFPVVKRKLCSKAEEVFEQTFEVNTLSLEDLYGGKICAALDRQHPRDLFDIKMLFDDEGLSNDIRKAFIVYLISHDRPIEEVLNPGRQDIKSIFETEFLDMANDTVSLEDLLSARETLIKSIRNSLTDDEKQFLLSFKNKNPDWQLLGDDSIQYLPAVKWKLHNLEQMKDDKHTKAYLKLEKYLTS